MKARQLHRWDLTPREAVALQRQLAGRVDICRRLRTAQLVAGADLSYARFSKRCHAAVVVCQVQDNMKVIERAWVESELDFPYVPGLLSFREAPPLLQAFEQLKHRPDAVILDGHGLAHPRRFGLACHVGLLLDIPTLGCAKSCLVGTYADPAARSGSRTQLLDRGEVVGAVLRTRDDVKPVFVSPGHKLDLEGAVTTVLSCRTKYRLPEPTRLAHQFVNALRRGEAM